MKCCKDCQERYRACHDTCFDYIIEKNKHNKIKNEARKSKILPDTFKPKRKREYKIKVYSNL